MIDLLKRTYYYWKYQYEIRLAENAINRYNKIIQKHEAKWRKKVDKATKQKDRKVKPYESYITNINKRIESFNLKLNQIK